jgi:hypothetical protein
METVAEATARAARTITRDEARDPAKYREVADAARKQGKEIIWLESRGDAQAAPKAEFDLDICYLRDQVIVRREAVRDPQEYKRVRSLCDQTRRSMQMVESFDDLPENLKQRVRDAVAGKPSGPRETSDPLVSGA